jgi:hypothetical protein
MSTIYPSICLLAGQPYDTKVIITVAVIIFICGIFTLLTLHSNLLREEISDMIDFKKNSQQLSGNRLKIPKQKAPYSLTKVQFGLWTVVMSSVYVYLALCRGECDHTAINKTILAIMGIYSGTTVISKAIDKKEISDNRPRHQNSPSQGLLADILSDDNGISLHRFQHFIWTLISIVVYLYNVSVVSGHCELPELSNTLLTLTGISSSTYLALKSKENDPPEEDQRDMNDQR